MTLLWSYTWKSSDGTRHEETMEAPSKERVFEILRTRGIKAIKVTQILRKRDRTLLYLKRFGALVAVGAVVGVSAYLAGERSPTRQEPAVPASGASAVAPVARHQIDITGIDLSTVFAYEAERSLAAFASPGRVGDSPAELPSDLFESLAHPIQIAEGDTERIAELKGIVAGIKRDVALFKSSGKTLEEISDWLRMRQQMEAQFRREIIGSRTADEKSRKAVNARLESLGLAPLQPGE